jgi:hypothetical protein
MLELILQSTFQSFCLLKDNLKWVNTTGLFHLCGSVTACTLNLGHNVQTQSQIYFFIGHVIGEPTYR